MGGLETRPFRFLAADEDCMVLAGGPGLKPLFGWSGFRGLKAPAPSRKTDNGNGKIKSNYRSQFGGPSLRFRMTTKNRQRQKL
jgi:hypothetical protein